MLELNRLGVLLALCALAAWAQTPGPGDAGANEFLNRCAVCHGADASGTDRGPNLTGNRRLRTRSIDEIRNIIRNGLPAGMPGFALTETELGSISKFVESLNAPASQTAIEGDVNAGRDFFFGAGSCASCHMVGGRGTANGPDLSNVGRQMSLPELKRAVLDPSAELAAGYSVVRIQLRSGDDLRGFARNESSDSLQLQTLDGQLHSFLEPEWKSISHETQSLMPPLKASSAEERNLFAFLSRQTGIEPGPLPYETAPVPDGAFRSMLSPRPEDWPTYYGTLDGNRYSKLDQITTRNVSKLVPQWIFPAAQTGLETTPVVSNGLMYVTAANHVYALDVRTGHSVWEWIRPRTKGGIAADATRGANRGVGVLGDRVFFVTDNAHLVCLHRLTGALLWEVKMADRPGNYGGTGAPLVVENLVVIGVAGADDGIRGFLDAYDIRTGQRAWRFWTVPLPGEPGSETWQGDAVKDGGGSTWLTGTYDPDSGLLFWPTGNPYPDTDGEDRKGDNLYTDCILALDAKTGKLKWFFQFTPHDLHDWDAVQPPVLVDAQFRGTERKLLLQANRNGFFYVLDRTTGKLLLAKPFVQKLTWASGIGPDGRPELLAGNDTTLLDTKTCPAVRGATNWYSPSFNPQTRLFYVMAVEDCGTYKRSKNGGFGFINDPHDPGEKVLRALDIGSGKIVWQVPQPGPTESNYSGVLSTAGGVLFYGRTGGAFGAADIKTGVTLWHFETNQNWKASPITYMDHGRQYVAVASGPNILTFALPSEP